MKKKMKKHIILLFGLLALIPMACEDDIDPVIEELVTERAFAPVGLTVRIRNQVVAELDWTVRDDADSFLIQISDDNFFNIIHEIVVVEEDLPIQQALNGETQYYARVKALSPSLEESKWASVEFETDPEQIFLPTPGESVQAEDAIVLWEAGSEVTHLFISPGNLLREITAAEATAGQATIEGLSGATDYVVTIYNGQQRRGETSFSTLKEANVTPLDDLAAIIAAAADGAELVLTEGEYEMGSVTINQSITIEGQKSYDKPVIYGQFVCETTVASISLVKLDVRGNGAESQSQFFNTETGCVLNSLLIEECEVSNYSNNFIYNNRNGEYGTITIRDSYIHDIEGGGGDGIDFRGGTLGTLTVENNTFANGFRSFLRMQAEGNIVFNNNTFYRVSILDNSNNRGLFRASGGGTISVTNSLFVETGAEGTEYGNWTRAGDMAAEASYNNNFYYNCHNIWVGEYTDPSQVDATEEDPGFVDPMNGDFTVTNQTVIDEGAGDPKWLQ